MCGPNGVELSNWQMLRVVVKYVVFINRQNKWQSVFSRSKQQNFANTIYSMIVKFTRFVNAEFKFPVERLPRKFKIDGVIFYVIAACTFRNAKTGFYKLKLAFIF